MTDVHTTTVERRLLEVVAHRIAAVDRRRTQRHVKVVVKLYGHMKRYAPGDRAHFSLRLEPGATLGDVQGILSIPKGDHTSLINGRRSSQDTKLVNGDTLVFLPSISGG